MSAAIRPATEADLAAVVRLQQRWAGEGITRGYGAADEAMLRPFLDGCLFVAEREGEIVGFVSGMAFDDERNSAVVPPGERYLEIEDLYVAPAERSGGLGARLVDAAAAWARAAGIRYLLAYSATRDVDRILHFYRAQGFESWSVQLFRDLG